MRIIPIDAFSIFSHDACVANTIRNASHSHPALLAYYYFCCLYIYVDINVRTHRACCPSRRSAEWVGSTDSHLVVCSCRFHIDDGQTGTFVHPLILSSLSAKGRRR